MAVEQDRRECHAMDNAKPCGRGGGGGYGLGRRRDEQFRQDYIELRFAGCPLPRSQYSARAAAGGAGDGPRSTRVCAGDDANGAPVLPELGLCQERGELSAFADGITRYSA